MLPLLGKTGIVHNPRHHRTVFLHGWQHFVPHLRQHLFVVPRRVGHKVMQRLMHATHMIRIQACGHRLDTLALAGQ
jgi:hypothetical protein